MMSPFAIDLVKKHIAQMPNLELVGACWNAIEAFEILKKEPIDLIFLDIQMPVLNGIDFVKSLQNPPKVIFTTAYRDYAVESYELDVVDYLLKPITFNHFFQAVNKYLAKIDHLNPSTTKIEATTEEIEEFIYVNTNRRFVRIVFSEILYIESLKDYIRYTLPIRVFLLRRRLVFLKKNYLLISLECIALLL